MTLRKELFIPSMTRLKKVARVSISIECILFIILGSVSYYIFGDKYTTNLIILRKQLDNYNALEWAFRIFLLGFFMVNTIGIPTYNICLRNMISHKIWLRRNQIHEENDSINHITKDLLEKLQEKEEHSEDQIEITVDEQYPKQKSMANNCKVRLSDISDNMFDRTRNNAVSVISVLDTIPKCYYALISLLPMYICIIIGILYPKLLGTSNS